MAYATATEAIKSAAATVSEIASTLPQSEKRRVMVAVAALTDESTPRFMIEIVRDDEPTNPRDWDNLGKMVCWHDRYRLGDKHEYKEPTDFMRELVDDSVQTSELVEFVKSGQAQGLRFEENVGEQTGAQTSEKTIALMGYWDFIKRWGVEYETRAPLDENNWQLRDRILNAMSDGDLQQFAERYNLIMPLYLYDHSMLSISTGSFIGRAQHAEWDSGQVGWTYVSYKDVAKEYGAIKSENIEKARVCLKSETETYDYYLRGSCYGFRLYDYGAEIDSCYGFLGSFQDAKEAIAEYLPEKAAIAIMGMNVMDSEYVAEYDDEDELGNDEFDDERDNEDEEMEDEY